jgi:hypothetical protein
MTLFLRSCVVSGLRSSLATLFSSWFVLLGDIDTGLQSPNIDCWILFAIVAFCVQLLLTKGCTSRAAARWRLLDLDYTLALFDDGSSVVTTFGVIPSLVILSTLFALHNVFYIGHGTEMGTVST